jgi:hypothetical protein
MHKKYAKDGVACVSVSLDPPKDEGRALKFLQKQHAKFANYLLDEPEGGETWQREWDFEAAPTVYVLDRQGKRTRFMPGAPDEGYEDVEKLVVKLLKAS